MKKIIIGVLLMFSLSSFSQKEEVFNFYENKVYKDSETDLFYIINEIGKTKFKELKYVAWTSNTLNVIDNRNKRFFLNKKLRKVKKPKIEEFIVCGTVAYFKVTINQNENNYSIIKFTDNEILGTKNTTDIIDTFLDEDIKDLYFFNKTKKLEFDENFPKPIYLILQYDDKKGIRFGNKTHFYDDIELINEKIIKVNRNKLYGYFNITKNWYKTLGSFKYGLAKIITKNNKTGYIDLSGNEYLKE